MFVVLEFFYSVFSKTNEEFSYLSFQIYGVRDHMNLCLIEQHHKIYWGFQNEFEIWSLNWKITQDLKISDLVAYSHIWVN